MSSVVVLRRKINEKRLPFQGQVMVTEMIYFGVFVDYS